MRGFDIRGIGPRVLRTPYNLDGTLSEEGDQASDALGGRAYYMGRIELEFPTSASSRSMGLRPSAFVDVGSVWSLKKPLLVDIVAICQPATGAGRQVSTATRPACAMGKRASPESRGIHGNSAKPRLAIGVGSKWVSPFGPSNRYSKGPVSPEGGRHQIIQLQSRNPIL